MTAVSSVGQSVCLSGMSGMSYELVCMRVLYELKVRTTPSAYTWRAFGAVLGLGRRSSPYVAQCEATRIPSFN